MTATAVERARRAYRDAWTLAAQQDAVCRAFHPVALCATTWGERLWLAVEAASVALDLATAQAVRGGKP